jgi:hypothetical protein
MYHFQTPLVRFGNRGRRGDGGDVQQLIAEDDLITSTLLPAALPRLSDGRTAPLDATWFAGSRSSASPTARSWSAGDPNGQLDLARDRRLADFELGGADRAALAQCAEFGQ